MFLSISILGHVMILAIFGYVLECGLLVYFEFCPLFFFEDIVCSLCIVLSVVRSTYALDGKTFDECVPRALSGTLNAHTHTTLEPNEDQLLVGRDHEMTCYITRPCLTSFYTTHTHTTLEPNEVQLLVGRHHMR